MVDFSGGPDDKLSYFQAITGLEDRELCQEILAAHNWDLELAVSSFTSSNPSSDHPADAAAPTAVRSDSDSWEGVQRPDSTLDAAPPPPPGLAWKLITLPFSVVSGSLGLISGAFGLGMWVAGGVLSRSLGLLGWGSRATGGASSSSTPLVSLSPAAAEALDFVTAFEREYGSRHPNFVTEGFMDALQRARREFRMLFVYLHSPEHPDTPVFCERSLCSDVVSAFVNENFVAWGGSIRGSEGFKMSNSLKASRFPFCAVVMQATNQRIALLQEKIEKWHKKASRSEGPKSPEQMIEILQRVVEESAPSLVAARLEAEERRNAIRLREEQDAAYRAALEADQARERQRKEEQERIEREAAEAERKRKEEQEAREREAHEAAEKEAALARRRQEKALSLGAEPEKGPNVTQGNDPVRNNGGDYELKLENEKKLDSLEAPPRNVCKIAQVFLRDTIPEREGIRERKAVKE
ncbi:Plant UBX domain-containing protein 10 [Asimina triloba]